MNIEQLYRQRLESPLYNTSYPIRPTDWNEFRSAMPLNFQNEKVVSLYIHIPFCQQLCSFCEYTRMLCPRESLQEKYVAALENDLLHFLTQHTHLSLQGFDIGGGTPTALSVKNFSQLMQLVGKAQKQLALCHDFEPSVEATFQTISAEKIQSMVENGIHRISLGVQSTNPHILTNESRQIAATLHMEKTLSLAHHLGIKKVNLDFMYGLRYQSLSSIQTDIELVRILRPEQVTLYELRTNMIKETSPQTALQKYEMYCQWYEGLIKLGYIAPFGQNTFSLDEQDMGVSSYLRHRMRDGTAYKGFGISAQSLCAEGVSYNIGKGMKSLDKLLQNGTFREEYTYKLPPLELASKYIAIAAYCGVFSLERLTHILGTDAKQVYAAPLDWCLRKNLVTQTGNWIRITQEGFKHYGAVFSLFYQRGDITHETK